MMVAFLCNDQNRSGIRKALAFLPIIIGITKLNFSTAFITPQTSRGPCSAFTHINYFKSTHTEIHHGNKSKLLFHMVSSTKNNNDETTSSSSSDSIDQKEEKGKEEPLDGQEVNSVVVGAGPAGLLTAIMLAQKQSLSSSSASSSSSSSPKQKMIQVYDRLSEPPSPTDPSIWSDVAKFYLIGLGSRGQNALKKYNVWPDVEKVCTTVVGRKDWSPESDAEDGVERIFTDRPVMTQVLPRDKLVGVLHEHIIENYSDVIQLNYGYEVVPEDFGDSNGSQVKIRVSRCNINSEGSSGVRQVPTSLEQLEQENDEECDVNDSFTISTNLLIAADGTARTVANEMERQDDKRWSNLNFIQKLYNPKPFFVKRYIDDNRRVYKTIPMKIPSSWRPDLNYSARTKNGRINYDALPADREGNYCGVLLIKESDEFARSDTDPKKLRALLDENLPQFSVLLDDDTVAEIAKKPVSYLPSFRYAGPRLNMGARTLILGDAVHTVKPYFGLGANSALEDVKVLDEALEETMYDIPKAVHLFSNKRAKESEALVKISRDLDRPGKLGLLTFLIPIILDGIFQKLLPKVFAPNTISMLQKEGITFVGVRRRKRMDRLGQLALIGTGLSCMGWGMKCIVKALFKVMNTSPKVGMGVIGMVLLILSARLYGQFNENLAPADVMPKKSK